jgi:D-alanyl-D-alanine carboxypeptidase
MRSHLAVALLAASTAIAAPAQQLPADTAAKVAAIAQKVLADTGVPSASVAIVQDGHLAYAQAFGLAHVSPAVPAAASMAYPIGSVSKQFTATALLLLQQQGKLSLDDPIAKYFPNLTRSNEVTLRNLMTMTSGYEDFAPQDYIIPAWRENTDPLANATRWATKPLDFTPGTAWQYSNTNYVLLGLVVEKVSGEPYMKFLREHVLAPLGLQGVVNAYTDRAQLQVAGYVSHALAPVRVQPLEGNGWYFGDGELAMPASTLAAWDLGIIDQKLLSPASYKQFETPFLLANGDNSHYGLGIFLQSHNGHRMIEHSGEVGGYVSENVVFPDDHIAIVVLTNQVASSAAHDIASAIAEQILPTTPPTATPPDTFAPQLKTILTGLQQGTIDRSLFTADCNDYFSADTLSDFKSTLAPLGSITGITRSYTHLRGGMAGSSYRVTYSTGTALTVSTYVQPEGKIEQLLVVGKD